MQSRGLEPPCQLRRQHLKLVCLPVPPRLRDSLFGHALVSGRSRGRFLRGFRGCHYHLKVALFQDFAEFESVITAHSASEIAGVSGDSGRYQGTGGEP